MKSISKWMAYLTVAAMTAAMLTGCGANGNNDGKSSGTVPASSEKEADNAGADSLAETGGAENEESETAEKTYDLGGRTVTIGNYSMTGPIITDSDPQYVQKMDYIAQIEEDFNCTINYVGLGNYQTYMDKATLACMNNEVFADLFIMNGQDVARFAGNGFLYPLDDLIDLDAEYLDRVHMDTLIAGGKHYSAQAPECGRFDRPVLFNKRILEENNIDIDELYELQANREWTWDKLLEYAQACTKVVNGETVTWGLGAYGNAPVFVEMLMNSNGVRPAEYDENGMPYNNLNDPAVMEAFQFAYDLVNTYHVCYTGSNAWGTWEELWKEGKVAFYMTEEWVIDPYFELLAGDEFGFLMCPIGPQADNYYDTYDPMLGYVMPAAEPDPEAIGALLERWLMMTVELEQEEGYDSYSKYETNWRPRLFDDRDWDTFLLGIDPDLDLPLAGAESEWFVQNILYSNWGFVENIPPRTWVEERNAQIDAAFKDITALPTKEDLETELEELEQ